MAAYIKASQTGLGPSLSGRKLMRKYLLGSSVILTLCLGHLSVSGAPLRAPHSADASAQQAIVWCRQAYGGDRGKAVNQAKPIWVENCFKQKTGYYPFQLGIPLYPPGYDWSLNPDRY
jgi:hypothetical protein